MREFIYEEQGPKSVRAAGNAIHDVAEGSWEAGNGCRGWVWWQKASRWPALGTASGSRPKNATGQRKCTVTKRQSQLVIELCT